MNFEQLKQRVQDTVVRDNVEFTDQLGDWLNIVQDRLVNMRNWWFLRAVAQSTLEIDKDVYNLPDNFKDDDVVYIVEDNEYHIIEMKGFQDLLKGTNATTTDMPLYWILGKKAFSLRPIPDKAYIIRFAYYKFLSKLVTNADENILTTENPEILIVGALELAYSFLQEHDRSMIEKQNYNVLLKELKRKDVSRQLARNTTLTPRKGALGTTYDYTNIGEF